MPRRIAREMKVVHRAYRSYAAFAVLGAISLCSLACTGSVDPSHPNAGTGGGQSGGGTANAGGAGGSPGPVDLSKGGPKLRVLTQTEYKNSVADLVGAVTTPLDLPPDLFVAGFTTIGGAEVTINPTAVEQYETASRAVAAEVFAD